MYYYSIDAKGLSSYIFNRSKYNVINESLQSIDNYVIADYQTISDIPPIIQRLRFHNYNNPSFTAFHFSGNSFVNLSSIVIDDDSHKDIREFVIEDIPNLEMVTIGSNCFKIDWNQRIDDTFRITNCPNLRQLEIGEKSFVNFKSFELSYLDSLQSIKFGRQCFCYADCSLKGE